MNKQTLANKKWRNRNPVRTLIHEATRRAKNRGLVFDLTYEDILPLIPDVCPVLGIKLDWGSLPGGNPNKPSIDRIDSSKGYTLDNIVVVSWRANNLKGSATPEELMKIAIFYQQFL